MDEMNKNSSMGQNNSRKIGGSNTPDSAENKDNASIVNSADSDILGLKKRNSELLKAEADSKKEETDGNSDKKAKAPKKKKAKKPKKIRPKKEYKKLKRFGTVLCALFLVGLISVSSVGLYTLKYLTDFVNGEVAINLDEYKANQSQTTILYTLDENGKEVELARLHGEENRIWVDLDEIPQNLQDAFIALEDMRFKTHSGVDWRRTISVAVLPSNRGEGGSTITQQLIKNLTGDREVTYIRKFREIQNALNLEKHYSKETILEAYLNTLYLDAGCYGVQTASEYYFGKDVEDLTLAECACIAAITQAPRANNPIINPEKNKERRDWALKCMLDQEFITQKEYEEALEYDFVFTTDDDYVPYAKDEEKTDDMITVTDKNAKEEVQGYYVDYVIDKVIQDLMDTRSYSYNEAWRLVYYGGLKIHVAVDTEIQSIMEDIYYNRKDFPDAVNSYGEEVQSSMVVMDYTGRVLGIVGQAGEKQEARSLNIATDSRRQPGSSIKPLSVYSLAIDSNMYTWSYPKVENFGIIVDGERWPLNFGGNPGEENTYETIQEALAPSHNTVPAQLVQRLGIDRCYNWLVDKFKITSLEEEDRSYSSLAVGGMEHGVYNIEMAAAYTTFGNGGMYYEPYCYYTVTNSTGSIVYLTHNDSGEQIMDRSSADVMNKLLQTVATAGDGTARAYRVSGFDMFAKTGTTSNEKDRWFIGGTPYYVCSVWMGYAKHAEELSFSRNYCGQLYQTVMNEIHKNLPAKDFDFSDEIVKRSYCAKSGLIASSGCAVGGTGWYKTDAIPSTCTSCSGMAEVTTNKDGEKTTTRKPNTTKPSTTKPSTTKPSTTKPSTTKPSTTKPATTKPAAQGD